MRFLADENFPGAAVLALREAGQDVVWILTEARGSPDEDVLKRAIVENRILITFDKDFGELAFHAGLPTSCSVVLFRIPMLSPSSIAKIAVTALTSRDDWAGHFAVIEVDRIRMIPLSASLEDENE